VNGKNSSVAIYKFRSRTEVSKLTVFFHSTKRERKHKVSHNGETPELVNLCRTKYKIEEDIEDKKDEEATVHRAGSAKVVTALEGGEESQFLDVEGGKIRIILDAANCRVISDTKAATHALYREAIIEKNEYKVLFDGAKSQRRARAWAANLFA